MRSILYIGAILMISAGIYGFVDYRKTSQKREFSSMYQSTGIETPGKEVLPVTAATAEEEKSVLKETGASKIKTKEATDKPVARAVKKIKRSKNKELSFKKFSRAPLREEVIEPVSREDKAAPKSEQ